ncbi:hypothetical protein SAMN05216600_107113 [Pseudomonas cuatrocienegasensis]|uniref:Uncharacterized protein n=1 Tax=Pseudomonas cuatrocienegasensis TaxID=543360 RepID=A0ABY1BD38_9PSED|nr:MULTISPECIES: hypothetical protein [Pseudomonas]OEC33951.1 hypothetical protein A7D25_16250 [Pseudomonas sp. 21C1]SEQ57549.1 hypothetical protein SAMN05216600_107113 [Pseudomonas cuatrocienegasensis]
MNKATWTPLEKYLAGFWLLGAAALSIWIVTHANAAPLSNLLQGFGLLALLISWSMSPTFFLQPLKGSLKRLLPKALLPGLGALCALQVASLLVEHWA